MAEFNRLLWSGQKLHLAPVGSPFTICQRTVSEAWATKPSSDWYRYEHRRCRTCANVADVALEATPVSTARTPVSTASLSYDRLFDLWRELPSDVDNGGLREVLNHKPINVRQIAAILRDQRQQAEAGQVPVCVYVVTKRP